MIYYRCSFHVEDSYDNSSKIYASGNHRLESAGIDALTEPCF